MSDKAKTIILIAVIVTAWIAATLYVIAFVENLPETESKTMISQMINQAAVEYEFTYGQCATRARIRPWAYDQLTTEFAGGVCYIQTDAGNLAVEPDPDVGALVVVDRGE